MKGVVLQRFLRLWYSRLSNGLSGSRWAPFPHFFSLCFSFCCSSTHYSPSYSERGRSQSVVAFPSPRKLRQITLDIVVLLYMLEQEPMTRSLHTNCTLESTLSRIFLFLELRYVGGGGGSLISRENTLTLAKSCHYWNTFVRPACDVNNRGPQHSYDWLLCKHPRKTPWELLLKIRRYGTGLTPRVSMEDGSSG